MTAKKEGFVSSMLQIGLDAKETARLSKKILCKSEEAHLERCCEVVLKAKQLTANTVDPCIATFIDDDVEIDKSDPQI